MAENEIKEEKLIETLSKKWYKSKTVVFNMFVALFTGIGSLLSDASFQEMMGDLFAYILTVVTVVNVYLRTVTNSAIDKIRK